MVANKQKANQPAPTRPKAGEKQQITSQKAGPVQSIRDNPVYQREVKHLADNVNAGFSQTLIQRTQETTAQSTQSTPNTLAPNKIRTIQNKGKGKGLPENLKEGIENLSGYSMDDVNVHYNSPRPAQLQAQAYTQGSDIHIAPGQDKHLPHEAWHVVQQKQGRVKPTLQAKGASINDDLGLEQEAGVMGAKALQKMNNGSPTAQCEAIQSKALQRSKGNTGSNHANKWEKEEVIQRVRNPKFEEYSNEYEKAPPEMHSVAAGTSADLARRSIQENWDAAYIINSILPYSELDGIEATINAMIDGLGPKDMQRISIVLGVNAPVQKEAEMDAAIIRAKAVIKNYPFPIALLKFTFRGKFPYGEMRNKVMHSFETRRMTEYFTLMHLHPYLSFQDFDASSRRVRADDGPHIFHVVDEVLAGGPTSAEDRIPIRPLMIAGGYRPQSTELLHKKTAAGLESEPIPGVSEADISGKLASFEKDIAADMAARDMYARLDPMLPYAPEPNLFVDATAAHRTSPISGSTLNFGQYGAEYAHLSQTLARYNAEELEAYYAPLYHTAKEEVLFEPDTEKEQTLLPSKGEIVGMLQVASQLDRHPVRGKSYYTDFSGMAVATDLSRLAYGALKSKRGLQGHDLGFITTSIFDTRQSKKGVKLADTRKRFRDRDADPCGLEYADQFVSYEGMESNPGEEFLKRKQEELGGLKRQKLDPSLAGTFSDQGPFPEVPWGIPQGQHKVTFTHWTALASDMKALRDQAYYEELRRKHIAAMEEQMQEHRAHIENLMTNALPLENTGILLGMKHWTEPDGDCGIHALAYIMGKDLDRRGMIEALQLQPQSSQKDQTIAAISGQNKTRWLSNDDVMSIATVFGFQDRLAIVILNNQTWYAVSGDPANAEFIIGGVPAQLGGFPNHWVVLERRENKPRKGTKRRGQAESVD